MRVFSNSYIMVLKLTYLALLLVLEPQEISMLPEVVGYLGHDVTLPCPDIPGTISQHQWEFVPPDGNKTIIIVVNPNHGVRISESHLKQRLKIEKQSLKITDVEMKDAGSYTCNVAAFPSGTHLRTTVLVVREEKPLSAGIVSGVVISVLLLVAILAAITYLIFIRRVSVRHRVCIDTRSPDVDVNRPAVIARQDVVYSDIKHQPSRDAAPPPSRDKRTDTARPDDVTYSEVVVLPRQTLNV